MNWWFQWAQFGPRLHVLARYRYEPTLDNGVKPYTELLAYVQQDGEKWKVLKHVPNSAEEIKPGLRLTFLEACDFAEQHFEVGI